MLSVSRCGHVFCVHIVLSVCFVCYCMILFGVQEEAKAIEEIGHEGNRQGRFAFGWLTDLSVSWFGGFTVASIRCSVDRRG